MVWSLQPFHIGHRHNVKSVTLQNEAGQTIEIRRGQKAGSIEMRHTGFHPANFGSYYEVAERVRHPAIASFSARFGISADNLEIGEAGAYAVIERRVCLLDPAEIALIREAIKKLK